MRIENLETDADDHLIKRITKESPLAS